METSSEESTYRWKEAAEFYERAVSTKSETGAIAAEYWQKIGFSYGLASRQAKNAAKFKSLRQLAVEAYRKAADFYEQENHPNSQGKKAMCLAIAEHNQSWLASNPEEKKKLLQRCRALGKKALVVFRSTGDKLHYGKTSNTLALCAYELQKITTTLKRKRKVIQEGLTNATDAIITLSKITEKNDFVFALSLSSILGTVLIEVANQEQERKDLINRCSDYSNQAIMLSEESDDAYSKAISRWASILCITSFETETGERNSLKYSNEMLRQASRIGDNYLVGIAQQLLAYATLCKVQEEADPEKRKQKYEDIIEKCEDAVHYHQLVCQDADIAIAYHLRAESYSGLAKEFATTPAEKLAFFKKAVKAGEKGQEHAICSGSPEALESNLHVLSKAYYYYSTLEPKREKRIELLKKALCYRKEESRVTINAFAANVWFTGVGMIYAAQIEADLARLEKDKEKKTKFFEDAIAHMEKGVSNCRRQLELFALPPLIAHTAGSEDILCGMLEERYFLTQDKENLKKANEVYADAAENFKKVDWPSRLAETFWKIAKNKDILGEYQEAAENFENAFAGYFAASRKIPQFNDFYLGYANYMRAWGELECAKLAHYNEDFGVSKKHYEKTSNLLSQSKSWSHLASNFYAWSLLEQAENLSRKESCQKSIEVFKAAIHSFQESKSTLKAALDKISSEDERKSVKQLIEAADIRVQFCLGRIAVEEAKVLDKRGEYADSSEKYASGAAVFRNLIQKNQEQTGNEVRPLFYLCQAWEKMTMAEAKASPLLYKKAAELFKLVNEYTVNESASLLALAHSRFCKALEAGTEFEITGNMKKCAEAEKHLDAAANYYLKAGFETFSEYAKATLRLFEAQVFMGEAKKETDPEKETKYFLMAEKVLQLSTKFYDKAKYTEKANQVRRLLGKVREEKKLALSLSEVLHTPAITSSTASFATMRPNEEKAVGLERFAHADVQAKLVQNSRDIQIGQELNLEIQIVNAGKDPVLLTKIEGIVPPGFQLVDKPDYCSFENSSLTFSGKLLDPLDTDETKILLRSSFETGCFLIKPKITCVDETGRQIYSNPEPLSICVSKIVLPDRVTTGCPELDNLLLGGIPENYAVLLTSPSSDEKAQLVHKFLEAGARRGQILFHITGDVVEMAALKEEPQSNLYLFVCNSRADLMIKNLVHVFKLNGVENLTDIDISLAKAFRTLDPTYRGTKRACIEIISDVILQHHAVITRKWLGGLLPELRSKGFTTLAVLNPQMHNQEEVQAIKGLFEGEIQICEKETDKGFGQFLRIRKLFHQRYLENELMLKKD